MSQKTKFQLSGLSCTACERVVSNRIKTIKDVESVEVNLQSQHTAITAQRLIGMDEVIKALRGTHYKVVSNL